MLTNDQLQVLAPSIFAKRPHPRLSEAYEMFPTIDAIEALRQENWLPVQAFQRKGKGDSDRSVTKHVVRLRNPDLKAIPGRTTKDLSFPELILTNSHNGTCSYQIMAGLFRLVCSNGLVVADSTFARIAIRHHSRYLDDMRIAAHSVAGTMPTLANNVTRFAAHKLTDEQRLDFAARAIALKHPEAKPFTPEQILTPRRREDEGHDLWTTYNVVQENLMVGGLQGTARTGRRITSRPVKDLNVHLTLNRGLWSLAEEVAA